MDNIESVAQEEKLSNSTTASIGELTELQLALVGGGNGEVVFH